MSYKREDPNMDNVFADFFSSHILAKVGFLILLSLIITLAVKFLYTDEDRMNNAIDISKLELRHSPYNYTFESSENAITVSLWQSGITATSKKAYDGDKNALAEWQGIKDNVLKYANSIDVNLGLQDIKNITVILQLVNEDNHARKLLVFKNCKLIYDVTKGE